MLHETVAHALGGSLFLLNEIGQRVTYAHMATLQLEGSGVRLCYGDVYATWPQVRRS